MNETSADFWASTITAQTYTGLSDFHLGKYFISLVVIILLMLVLAWLAYKAGWLKTPPAKPITDDDQVIFYSQFSHDQTLVIVNQTGDIHCYIYRNKDLLLATPLPGLTRQSLKSTTTRMDKQPTGKLTFQDVMMNVLNRKKGNR